MRGAKIGNKNRQTHGMKKTRFYSIWIGMKTRCLNKNHVWYKHYGGKGIKICKKWLVFQGFYDDMFQSYLDHVSRFSEKNTSLDRVDGEKNYCIENCRWATKLEQSMNTRNTILISYNQITLSLHGWSKKTGVSYYCLWNRYKKGIRPPQLFNNTTKKKIYDLSKR